MKAAVKRPTGFETRSAAVNRSAAVSTRTNERQSVDGKVSAAVLRTTKSAPVHAQRPNVLSSATTARPTKPVRQSSTASASATSTASSSSNVKTSPNKSASSAKSTNSIRSVTRDSNGLSTKNGSTKHGLFTARASLGHRSEVSSDLSGRVNPVPCDSSPEKDEWGNSDGGTYDVDSVTNTSEISLGIQFTPSASELSLVSSLTSETASMCKASTSRRAVTGASTVKPSAMKPDIINRKQIASVSAKTNREKISEKIDLASKSTTSKNVRAKTAVKITDKPFEMECSTSSRRTSLGKSAASAATSAAAAKGAAVRRTSLAAQKVADARKTTAAEPSPPTQRSTHDQSNKANATGGKPGASGSKATSQQQIKGAHQPDLVSNSIGSRAHAAQEISRLEALCEARTKELTFAKMQIKSASQGFDAMSVIVQYLTFELGAFSTPDLIGRLKAKEKKINDLRCSLDDLRKEKSRIESTMHDLIQSHKEATEAMRADHRAQINAIEERVSEKYEESQQKVIDQHSEEVKTLKSYHEKRHKELQDQTERACEELRRKHAQQLRDLEESDERHLTELQKQHEIKLEEITKRFEEIKFTLHDKVYTLKSECDELRSRSLMYEEALQRDTSFQVQLALAPYRDLPQEINSLQAVLDMRNKEIHELRVARAELEHRLDELPTARERIISLEQKIENLEAIITMKADYERQLVEKHQMLLRRFDKESKANKRLSMDNEELMYRLNESEDFMLSPTPECRTGNGRSPDGQSPDVISRRGFCRSPHDGATGIPSLHAGVTRRQRTCSTSSSDEKRSSTISMRSDDGKTT